MQNFGQQTSGFAIDARNVSAENRGGPLPAGCYLAQLDKYENSATRAGDGMVLKVEFTVLSAPFEGRKIYENFTYSHPNQDTVRIAFQGIKQLAIAAFCSMEAGDQIITAELLDAMKGREIYIQLAIKKDNQGKDRNDVVEFFTKDGRRVTDQGLVTAPQIGNGTLGVLNPAQGQTFSPPTQTAPAPNFTPPAAPTAAGPGDFSPPPAGAVPTSHAPTTGSPPTGYSVATATPGQFPWSQPAA